jgi:hypothetical protein
MLRDLNSDVIEVADACSFRYRFLYGFPPFHDDTPEKVFENILSRKIDWHEDEVDVSPDAREFMERLMCTDSSLRLGVNGSGEVKAHAFVRDTDWDNLLNGQVDFVPKVSDPESTDYFDPRGAVDQVFEEEEAEAFDEDISPSATRDAAHHHAASASSLIARVVERVVPRERARSQDSPHEEFGAFNFRNLPVLKQANDDVIRKMRDEQMQLLDEATGSTTGGIHLPQERSNSLPLLSPILPSSTAQLLPPASLHSRHRSAPPLVIPHSRRPRRSSVTMAALNDDHPRRRTAVNEVEALPPNDSSSTPSVFASHLPGTAPGLTVPTILSSTDSAKSAIPGLAHRPSFSPTIIPEAERTRTIDCLVAGKNPISNKVLETVLVRLGCRCVVVPDGGEAILVANSVRFDVIWMDLQMPVGELQFQIGFDMNRL